MEEDHVKASVVEPKDLPPIWDEVAELLGLATYAQLRSGHHTDA